MPREHLHKSCIAVALVLGLIGSASSSASTVTLAGRPYALSQAGDSLDVFGVGSDGALWHKYYRPYVWGPWESLGGSVTGTVSGISFANGHLDIFGVWSDGTVRHNTFYGGWSGWQAVGGAHCVGDVKAISWAPGRIDLFCRHEGDNQLFHNWLQTDTDNGAWHAWEGLGGVITNSPAAVSWGPGHLDIEARGTDGGFWHKWFYLGWSAWEHQGTGTYSNDDFSSTSWGSGRIDVFASDGAGALVQKYFDNGAGGWANRITYGDPVLGGPVAWTWGQYRMDVAWRSSVDQHVYARWWDPSAGWSSSTDLTGEAVGGKPAVTSWGWGRSDIFVRGAEGDLCHLWWTNGAWSQGCESLGFPHVDYPGAAEAGTNEVGQYDPNSNSYIGTAPAENAPTEEQDAGVGAAEPSVDISGAVAATSSNRYCKTTKPPGGKITALGATLATYKVTAYWCHGTWTLGTVHEVDDDAHAVGALGNIYVKFDRFSDPVRYYYNYAGRGPRSGWAYKRRAYFLITDPTHNISLKTVTLFYRLYLHGDGTYSSWVS
jgi:hypothetical protein